MVMRVPKTTLEARGFVHGAGVERELAKLRVAWRTAAGELLEDVFANYYPRDRRAEVYLGRLGHDGKQFRVISAERFGYPDFVQEFNDEWSLNLKNVKLGTSGDGVWMEVDRRRIRLSRCMMNTFGSMVNVRGHLEDESEIKFEYDGKSGVAGFRGHPAIESMQVYGDELEVCYVQSKSEKHAYRIKL